MAFLKTNREGMGLTVIGVASMALVAALGAFIYSLTYRADGLTGKWSCGAVAEG